MILLALKALAGGKMELTAAVCTIQQPGEQSLPFRFRGAALIFAQLLHSVPLCLRHDCLLCIRYDEHILRRVGDPLFHHAHMIRVRYFDNLIYGCTGAWVLSLLGQLSHLWLTPIASIRNYKRSIKVNLTIA